jgi:hypothetical protein
VEVRLLSSAFKASEKLKVRHILFQKICFSIF